MHPNDLSRRVYFVIATVAVIAVVSAIVINELWEYSLAPDVVKRDFGLVWRVIKYSITAIGLTGTTLWVLNWAARKFPKVLELLGVPNFSGRWEGWRFSAYSKEWLPMCIEVNQSLLTVATASYIPNTISHSLISAISTHENEPLAKLTIVYRADFESYDEGFRHLGTMILRLKSQDQIQILEGQYFTDRKRDDGNIGTQGTIRLSRASAAISGNLHFVPSRWAMPRPTSPPGHYPRP